MAIKGLVDKSMETDARAGRLVRLGTIQKGERKGFGKSVELFDYDYLRFSPENDDERLEKAYYNAYGSKPKMIDDVRIPVDLAGNFQIEDCSWLTAGMHTKNGSSFLARSDGETIHTMRNEKDGRNFIRDGVPHKDHSRIDQDGNDCFVYDGKTYPWQKSFAIDLILPKFNRMVWSDGLFGLGVVTLITTSTNDIAKLTEEYYGIINDLVTYVASPFAEKTEIDRVRRNIPLRRIPLTLYRTQDTISTPNWSDKNDTAGRKVANKWMLHWSLSAKIAEAAQLAMDTETRRLIEGIANRPSLLSGGRHKSIEELNGDLFADSPQIEAPKSEPEQEVEIGERYTGPDWEEIGTDVWEEVDDDNNGPEPSPYDWCEAAMKADTLDAFAQAVYMEHEQWFDDAAHCKRGIKAICGDWKDINKEAAWYALAIYVSAVADDTSKKDAAAAAKESYKNQSEVVF